MTSPTPIRPASVPDLRARSSGGHGRRLAIGFDAVATFPALSDARDRVLRLLTAGRVPVGELVAALESDVALATGVLRVAGHSHGDVESVRLAVQHVGVEAIQALAARTPTFDLFDGLEAGGATPEGLRIHAVATQRAAERIAAEIGSPHRDRLVVGALLHDVGKLVLAHAYPAYPHAVHAGARTPEERVLAERHELGVDHATVGGVLARRWGLSDGVASIVERHHAPDGTDDAGVVRLADMLAHYAAGSPVSRTELVDCASALGISDAVLRRIVVELPNPLPRPPRAPDPCPLSPRERQILERLSEGKVYKQIGAELGLSPSTVRSHLHNVYGKLGAADRAQAVLIAARRGWLDGPRRLAP